MNITNPKAGHIPWTMTDFQMWVTLFFTFFTHEKSILIQFSTYIIRYHIRITSSFIEKKVGKVCDPYLLYFLTLGTRSSGATHIFPTTVSFCLSVTQRFYDKSFNKLLSRTKISIDVVREKTCKFPNWQVNRRLFSIICPSNPLPTIKMSA